MAQVPHAEEGLLCPLHKQDMSQVCHKCPWWTMIRGKHPQNEEMIDNWYCAIAVLPVLLVENAQQSRATGAAVESFRNGVVDSVMTAVAMAANQQQGRLLDARRDKRS
ncbi:hypothetical protein [Bradyrhizobium sp. USDA 10063]